MKVRFVAEKGNKGEDNVAITLSGIKNLPKFLIITAEDFTTAIGTGKAFIDNNELKIEADLREQEFHLYPTIGFESIVEETINESIIIKESELHTISLQPHPNTDDEIRTIFEQINNGTAEILE